MRRSGRCRRRLIPIRRVAAMVVLLFLAPALGIGCSSTGAGAPADASPDGPAPPGSGTAQRGPGDGTSTAAGPWGPLAVEAREGRLYLSLETWERLMALRGWDVDWHAGDGRLVVRGDGFSLEMVVGVPVAGCSGRFLPLEAAPVWADGAPAGGGAPLLPVTALGDAFGWRVTVASQDGGGGGGTPGEGQVIVHAEEESAFPASPEPPRTPEAIVAHLGQLQLPLEGADPEFPAGHLPGAPRDYRHGTHEGFDWYGYAIGVTLSPATPVRAMAAGVVVRADHGWNAPTAAERQAWLDLAREAGGTPAWVLDLLRGRQVWVQGEDGLLVRYAHLSAIPPDLGVGDEVSRGAIIGRVGNSGTSAELEGPGGGLHLHADVLIRGENVWLDLSPAECRRAMRRALGLDG